MAAGPLSSSPSSSFRTATPVSSRSPHSGSLFFLLAVLLALAIHPVTVSGQIRTTEPRGSASYKFLKLPLAPRTVALGGAGVADATSASELDLNPAAAMGDSSLLFLGRGYPFQQFQAAANLITYSLPYRGYRILLNARYLGYERIEGHTENPDEEATAYSAHTLKLQSGLAGRYRRLAYAATVNYAESNISYANYGTFMLNAGFRYEVYRGLSVGASGTNGNFYTTHAKFSENEAPYPPTTLQGGLAYRLPLGYGFETRLAADLRRRNDERFTFPLGLEVSWQNILFARAGFPVAEQEPGIAAGVGLQWSRFRFEYAFQGHETLSPGHYLALGLSY